MKFTFKPKATQNWRFIQMLYIFILKYKTKDIYTQVKLDKELDFFGVFLHFLVFIDIFFEVMLCLQNLKQFLRE